jgi:PTH2 family peptidyl-tRNA hydrolase
MNHYSYKQVIVFRADLLKKYPVSKGKISAQVAHGSMGALLNYKTSVSKSQDGGSITLEVPSDVFNWLEGSFAKTVLKCESLEQLLDLEAKCRDNGLNCCVITDNGTTAFEEPTVTCIAIGPHESARIDEITGDLKLL